MIINVLNKDLVPVTFIDNDIPGLPSYYKDTLIDYLSLGTASFEFTILKSKNNIIQDYSRFFNDETCFSFEKNGKQYAVFPAGSDGFYETDTEITYKCLSLDRELSLEYVDKFDNSSTHTLQWYIDYFELISNNQIEIGRNDVADYTRVIKYDSQDTKLNRLLSLINNFDAEFEFITKLTNNGAVDKIILNIVKKRDDSGKGGIGAIRDDVELVYGKNVKGIERTYNFEFFNASKVIGKDGTNWNSSEFSYINSDGVEEFYKRKNDDTAFAPLSAQKYPAHLRKDSSDIWLRKNFETEYTTPAQMWGYIVQQFKSYAYPQITYKIKTNSNLVSQALDGKLPIQIGDTVTIEDDNFSNEQGDFGLILRARATEIKSSDSNPETNEITFENFVELQNDLSDDLMTQVNQLVDAATPFRAELSTTNGTQFKNGTGSTTLSAHIFKGSATAETIADSYEWSKDGTVVANVQEITVDASGVTDKAVYSFKATVAGKVVGSQSVTITNVNDGIAGKDGVGIVDTTIEYLKLTDGQIVPNAKYYSSFNWNNLTLSQHLEIDYVNDLTLIKSGKHVKYTDLTVGEIVTDRTGELFQIKEIFGTGGDDRNPGYINLKPSIGKWSKDIPAVNPGEYLWTRTTWFYSDNTNETGFSVAKMGEQGPKGDPGHDGIAGKDGNGIKTTVITYAISSSGTVTPANGWTSQVPTLVKGQYLWTKTLWTYTDNSSETGYTVSYIAKDGNNGNDGIAGKDGTGIKTTTITYAGSTSGTTAPASGWNSQVPNVPAGQYLWTKTVWDYTDKTSETGYSVSKFGEKGDKGDQGVQGIQGVDGRQGIPGPKGADGKTQYTHIAYANSADGVTNFSTSDSNRTYIGMYVDFNIDDSNTPSDYSWTLVKGADGTQGTPGKAGVDGKTPYFHTAWSYSADGKEGFTTVYPNLNLLDGTRDFKPRGAGNGTENQNAGEIYFTQNKTVADLFKAGDYITISYDIEFLNTELYSSSEDVNITIQMYGGSYTWISRINAKNVGGKFYTNDSFKSSDYVETPTHKVKVSRTIQLTQDFINANANVNSIELVYNFIPVGANVRPTNLKIEPAKDLNSTATPHMPSSSEVTTADWPKYIGQYTDFTQADSTNPSAYTWSLIRGNDGKDGKDGHDGRAGKDGVGIKATVITYAISTSGTTAPTTGWTSSVPSLVKGQYLWTKSDWIHLHELDHHSFVFEFLTTYH